MFVLVIFIYVYIILNKEWLSKGLAFKLSNPYPKIFMRVVKAPSENEGN